ncbi:MAG: hypothetical protein ACYTFG_07290 [Planctomycetota bacterium]|jgi:hypothetical protein
MRFLAAFLLLAAIFSPGLPARAGEESSEPLVYFKSTETSAYIEENFENLASSGESISLYRVARSAIDSEDEGLVRAGPDRLLIAPLYVRERISTFRGPTLKAWRSLAEPEARGAAARAGRRPGPAALEAVYFRYPNTEVAMRTALNLADVRIEEGRFCDALDVLEDASRWLGPDGLKTRILARSHFVRGRVGLEAGVTSSSFLTDARNARHLCSAFNRPLGKVTWDPAAVPPGHELQPVLEGKLFLGVSPHRIVAVSLRPDGSPSRAAPVWKFVSSIASAACIDTTAFLTSRPEASPWRLHSGKKEKPVNRIFALEPTGEGLVWVAKPSGLSGSAEKRGVFTSGPMVRKGRILSVITRSSSTGALESALLTIDPRHGQVIDEAFLLMKGARGGKRLSPAVTWRLLEAQGGILAADGEGTVLFVKGGAVQWVRLCPRVPPLESKPRGGGRTMVTVGNRVVAAPRDGVRVYAFRLRDGTEVASRAVPPVRALVRGEGGTVWMQGEGTLARVLAGDPDLRVLSRRAIPLTTCGVGFPFASLFAVPKKGGLLLVGSSGRFLRSLVQPGSAAAFLVRRGVLYRLRRDVLSAFRIPETAADRALGTIPYVASASASTARTVLIPWLSSEDPKLRRWAADLLRQITGQPFDFDPDGPEDERKRAIDCLRASGARDE